MILYINKSYCSSLEQLRGYFKGQIDINSDIYWDLLESGRSHDISNWLQERGETDLACRLEKIDYELGDSAFFAEMCKVILDEEIQTPTRPEFSQCYSVENVQHEVTETGAAVFVYLKVLMSLNEKYELKVQTNWGTRGEFINPFYSKVGEVIKMEFDFRKRPNGDLGEIKLYVDDKAILLDEICAFKSVNEESLIPGVKAADKEWVFPLYNIILGKTTIQEIIDNEGLDESSCQYYDDHCLLECAPGIYVIALSRNSPVCSAGLCDESKDLWNKIIPIGSEWSIDKIALYCRKSGLDYKICYNEYVADFIDAIFPDKNFFIRYDDIYNITINYLVSCPYCGEKNFQLENQSNQNELLVRCKSCKHKYNYIEVIKHQKYCPNCGSTDFNDDGSGTAQFSCNRCGYIWGDE